MATIKDIARETGLGLATISKYINGGRVKEKNRIAIEQAIEKLGYTANEFARGLKTNRSKSIGIVIPDLGSQFVSSIIWALEEILRRSGYSAIICNIRDDPDQEQEAVRFILSKRVDGLVNIPMSTDGVHLEPALEKGVPVVLIDQMLNRLNGRANAVLVDNVGGAASAVSQLIDAGHSNIGIILGPHGVFTVHQRLLGYSQALIENAIIPREELISHSDYSMRGGYESMRGLLKNKDITAVFTTNYEMTLGAIIAINEIGVKIPDQLSLIGFDSQQLTQVIQPKLTVVTQPLRELGETAAKILLDAMESRDNPPPPKTVTLTTEILPGHSVRHI
jgi:LacI family transcriptional regulator